MIVVYDFDKTLTYKDTLLGFFLSFSKNPLKLFIYFLAMVFAKFKIISNTSLKKLGVRLYLYGRSKDKVKKVAESYSKRIETNSVYRQMDFSCDVFVVSASFEEYLLPLFPSGVKVVGSKLEYKNGRVCNIMLNCYGKNKKKLLNDREIVKIDRLFTDSYSDVDLAGMSSEICVVKNDSVKLCGDLAEFKRYFGR